MAPTKPGAALALLYAVVAYVAFVASLGWAVTFLADRHLPRGIDQGVPHSTTVSIVIDLALLLLFAIQHSVMARAGFKRWIVRRLPSSLERSTYVLTASAILLLLFWQWKPLDGSVWTLHGGAADATWGLFTIGWVIALSSTLMVDHMDFFGLSRAYRYAQGRTPTTGRFVERWLYLWVRHPLMLGLLLAFWSTPDMTGGHLLFSLAATGYIAVGLHFEERDLASELGDTYLEYRARVPAVIPGSRALGPGRSRGTASERQDSSRSDEGPVGVSGKRLTS